MRTKFLFLLNLSAVFFQICNGSSSQDTLHVGSAAPAIHYAQWLKGPEVSGFKKGKVYIIEFTNRFCGPCRVSIPHLSEISKKYADKATVLAVYVGENDLRSSSTAYVRGVAQFVKDMGNKMDYSVCVDNLKQTSFKSWVYAATGYLSFPWIFIVDQNQKIVWIGNPLDGNLDRYVGEVIRGKLNTDSAQKRNEQENAVISKISGLNQHNRMESKEGLHLMDSMLKDNPYWGAVLTEQKFNFLLNADKERAHAFARQLLNTGVDGKILAEIAFTLAVSFHAKEGDSFHPDWSLPVSLIREAVRSDQNKSKTNLSQVLSIGAMVYAQMGNFQKSIELEKKSIDYTNEYNLDKKDSIKTNSTLDSYREKLAINDAVSGNDFKRALFILDSLRLTEEPDEELQTVKRFDILLKSNEADAYSFAWQFYKSEKSNWNGDILNKMASCFLDSAQNKILKNPDWNLAIALAEKAYDSHLKIPLLIAPYDDLATEAKIYFVKGDFPGAIGKQREVVTYLKTNNKEDDMIIMQFEKTLSEYDKNTRKEDSSITAGSPAPDLKVSKWFKGPPVVNFDKGKVYVIEFWATWCKPCIASIPGITNLSKTYEGKVQFVGINVMDEASGLEKVTKFVRDQGDKMDYAVAMDDDKYMERHWLRNARQGGIPCSFIIDQTGRIAWIGHPDDLDSVLKIVLNGHIDYDYNSRTTRISDGSYFLFPPSGVKIDSFREEVWQMIMNGKYRNALMRIDKIHQSDPESASGLTDLQYRALLHLDPMKAYDNAQKLVSGNGQWKLFVMYEFAGADSLPKKCYQLAIDVLEPLSQTPEFSGQSVVVEGLAEAYFHLGDKTKAIEIEQDWIAFITKVEGPENLISSSKKRLAKFNGQPR